MSFHVCWMAGMLMLGLFCSTGRGQPGAKDDCRIEFQQDGNGRLAYVKNTNAGRRVRVTVTVTSNTARGGNQRFPDKVFSLAPGERVFCGGVTSGDATFTYTVSGASYE